VRQHIRYLNTDLDLVSDQDLTDLTAALKSRGVDALHVTRGDDGKWYATLEVDRTPSEEPEPDIIAILDAVEALGKKLRSVWTKCSLRELNIGYDCGSEPWAFNHGISAKTLGRIAALNAPLRFTLYPPAKPVRVAAVRKPKKR
jgi:hypothetical protein